MIREEVNFDDGRPGAASADCCCLRCRLGLAGHLQRPVDADAAPRVARRQVTHSIEPSSLAAWRSPLAAALTQTHGRDASEPDRNDDVNTMDAHTHHPHHHQPPAHPRLRTHHPPTHPHTHTRTHTHTHTHTCPARRLRAVADKPGSARSSLNANRPLRVNSLPGSGVQLFTSCLPDLNRPP